MYWAIKANQTVTLTAKLSASDATITSVVITAYTNKGTGKTIDVTVGGRTFGETITLVNKSNDYTLTGSASGDLALIMKSTTDKKSHIVKTVKINYTDASSSNKTATKLSFEKPAFSFATTDDLTSFKGQTATLKAGETELTGKTIKYSKSGDDIFSSFNEADGTLALNGNAGTATVTANFDGTNDETYNSSSASYTITVNKIYGSLADLKKDITDTEKTFTLRLTNAVVSYAVGDRVYIEDESTGILIFYTNASNVLKAGQKLNGDVTVKAETYYKLPEITAWTPITLTAVDGSDIPLTKLTIADLINDYDKYEGRRIILENATVTTGTTGGDRAESGKISQGENEITLRTVAGIKTTKDDVIDVIGFLGKYNTGLQYNVFSQDDITVKSSVEATTLSFDTEVTEFNVEKGKEKTFTAPKATVKTTATGEIVEGAKVTYESNAPTIAAVDAEGNVTFGSVFGTATITASYSGDATHRASKNSYTINYGKVKTTMSWSATEVTANLGEKFTVPTLSLTADNVSILEGKTIKYTSTDENVAMVDENGKVVLMDKEGKTTITATFAGDETYAEASASYTLTVKDPNKLEVTFDFTKPENYGYGVTSGNTAFGEGEGDVLVNATLTEGIVTLKNTTCSGSGTRFYSDGLRTYTDNEHTLYVPAGYRMTSISFSFAGNKPTKNYTIGSAAKNTSWTGEARKVIIKYTGTNKPIESLTVAYKKIELSPLTLNEDDNDIAILENENTYANVTATRSMIADGGWYTFCVPFDIEDIATTPLKDAEIRKYKSMTGTTMNFEPTTSLKAMHAYLVKPTSNIVNPEFEDVLVVSEGDNVIDGENGYKFVGIYSKYPLALDGTNLFLGANNTFYLPTPEDYTLKALRGYFVVPEGTSASKMGINIDGETTSISALNTADAISGKVYNLNGQYVGNNVKTLQKGIYVVNGKKIIIK